MPSLSDAQAYWDREISALESRLAKARAVRDALADAEFAGLLVKSLGVDVPPAKVSPTDVAPRVARKSRVLDEMVEHFRSIHNEWQSLADLSKVAGLNPHTARQALYMRYADLFERRSDPNSMKNVTQFRLAEYQNGNAQEKAPLVLTHQRG